MSADLIGAFASALCLLHCLATPFIFIAKACSVSMTTCCAHAPVWWQVIDYVFIIISFTAIYYATKNSSVKWIQYALWGSWALLLVFVLGETLSLALFPAFLVYLPALAIVGLHVYNLKYCQCAGETCSLSSNQNL